MAPIQSEKNTELGKIKLEFSYFFFSLETDKK